MKVLIMTLGTRGDVQPFIALARGLLAAGHEVVLAAPERFAGFVAGYGVPFAGVDDGPMRLMDDPAMAAVFDGGVRVRLRQVRTMPAMFTQLLADCWAVASHGAGAGADLVVHNGQIIAGQHVAEKLGYPGGAGSADTDVRADQGVSLAGRGLTVLAACRRRTGPRSWE